MAPSTRVVGLFSGPMPRHGATQVNDLISLVPVNEDQCCTYFCDVQPVFQHPPGRSSVLSHVQANPYVSRFVTIFDREGYTTADSRRA